MEQRKCRFWVKVRMLSLQQKKIQFIDQAPVDPLNGELKPFTVESWNSWCIYLLKHENTLCDEMQHHVIYTHTSEMCLQHPLNTQLTTVMVFHIRTWSLMRNNLNSLWAVNESHKAIKSSRLQSLPGPVFVAAVNYSSVIQNRFSTCDGVM